MFFTTKAKSDHLTVTVNVNKSHSKIQSFQLAFWSPTLRQATKNS